MKELVFAIWNFLFVPFGPASPQIVQQQIVNSPAPVNAPMPPAGMAVWYSGDCVIYTSSICASPVNGTVYSNGATPGPTANWFDRSGNANDLQPVGGLGNLTFNTNQINGQPAMTSNSAAFAMTTAIPLGSNQWSMFVVSKTSATGQQVFISGNGNSSLAYWTHGTGGSGNEILRGSAVGCAVGTTTGTSSWVQQNVVVSLSAGAISGTFRYARSADSTFSGSTCAVVDANQQMFHDYQGGGFYFGGQIAEILIYKNNTVSVSAVETYLNTKYGL